MKTTTTTISAIILLMIMSGCGRSSKNESGDYITVDVSKDYPERGLILQDVMDVEYIPLETTDEFITHGDVMDVGEKFLIVKNTRNDGNIFVFDRATGKGIRKINRLGQGVEEYSVIRGVALDEDNNELFVTHTGKISVYDLDGQFKRSFNFTDAESDYLKVYNYDRDNLITYNNKGSGMMPDQQLCHLILSKQDGSVVREIATPYQGHRTPSIYSMDTEIFLFVEAVTSRYCFMRATEKKLDKKMRFLISRLAYDKQEDSIFEYEIYNTDFLYERPVYWISAINQDIANWYPFDASELTEAYKEGKLKGRLNEIASKMDEDSNPVIMLTKYKK